MNGVRGFLEPTLREVTVLRQRFVAGVVELAQLVLGIAGNDVAFGNSFFSQWLDEPDGFGEVGFDTDALRIADPEIVTKYQVIAFGGPAKVFERFDRIALH